MENTFKILAIRRHRFGVDGSGITTLVGLANCPLNCEYCLNKKLLKTKEYKIYSIEDLIKEIIIDYCYFVATGGGVTFGGGESLLHTNAIIEFAKKLPPNINITLETSLNVPNELLKQIMPYTNQFIIDIKSMDKNIYEKYTKKNIDNLLINLKYIVDNKFQEKCIIRIPLIPNYNNKEDVNKSEEILKKMGFQNFDKFTYKLLNENDEIIT